MSSSDSNRYLIYFNIYYYFYLIFGVASQFTLLYLIAKKSPKSIDSLKCFLYNTCVGQILTIFVGFATQNRALPNLTSLAVLSNGPCKYSNPYICFAGYHIFLALSMDIALSISNTVAFRYLILKFNGMTKTNIRKMILIMHVPSVLLVIIPFLDTWDFDKARELTYNEHPTYNLSIYEPFSGFADVTSLPFLTATALVAIGAYGIPLGSAIFTRLILKMIHLNSSMSERTKSSARMMIHGLTCQTILPLVCYCPIISIYLISQITGNEIILSQHITLLSPGIPALIDPFISFYFIVPYRNAIYRFVTRDDSQNDTIIISSVHQRTTIK